MDDYLKAWDAVGHLLAEGRSWSGRERNVAFLNTRNGRFVTVSASVGLDQLADSRAIGLTDWDQDGDVDLWYASRTAPRLSLMLNPTAGPINRSISLLLTGTKSNRDAVGAVVEMHESDGHRSVRFVSAGNGYLSQSTKWLHFGLGDDTQPRQFSVRWPGGSVQEVGPLAPGRYRIEQDHSDAVRVGRKVDLSIAANSKSAEGQLRSDTSDSSARIVPHARLPVPALPIIDRDGNSKAVELGRSERPTLIVLWASHCLPCIEELKALTQTRWNVQFDVMAMNVELLEEPTAARLQHVHTLMNSLELSELEWCLASSRSLERLDMVRRAITSAASNLEIPCSFLFDAAGRLQIVYRGMLPMNQLHDDLKTSLAADRAPADDGLPFAGRRYLNPLPADLLALPSSLAKHGDPRAALAYLRRHVGTPKQPKPSVTADWYRLFADQLASLYLDVGIQTKDRTAIREALEVQPDHWHAMAAMASFHAQRGETARALENFERMLKLRPHDRVTANNIAWILATDSDPNIRDPSRAIAMAERICEQTQRKLYSALDTLAAAYAADGRFDEAKKTATESLDLARRHADVATQKRIELRLERYRVSARAQSSAD